jgi:hypothetical protein
LLNQEAGQPSDREIVLLIASNIQTTLFFGKKNQTNAKAVQGTEAKEPCMEDGNAWTTEKPSLVLTMGADRHGNCGVAASRKTSRLLLSILPPSLFKPRS